MLDFEKLDEWLRRHRDECLRCGAEQLAFTALQGGFMLVVCDACGHKISVRVDTIRAIAFSDEAMKTLRVLSADKDLPMRFKAECDMVLSLARLYRKFFENE